MPDSLILLPPSEGKTEGGTGPVWTQTSTADGVLAEPRRELLDALADALRDDEVENRDVLRYDSDEVLERAVSTDLAIGGLPTMPAADRYDGVVLEGAALDELDGGARSRFDETSWFVSGLWGIVSATDPIPDYRLKFGAKVPGFGIVGTWWKNQLQPLIEELAADRLVWNLLTTEHGKVWKPGDAAEAVATVEFTTVERGRRGVSNYHGKYLKGRFVHHLVTTDPASLDAASEFSHEGWKLDVDASTLQGDRPELVFSASEG